MSKNQNNENGAKKVTVILPLLENAEDDTVFVAVNGENYLIKRGEEVEVPDYIAFALKTSRNAKAEAMKYLKAVTNS